MGVVFFNTLTRAREEFVPITPGKATLYTCGPTIHDYAHIGNFRTFIFSDLVRRYLRYRGYEVFHVLNLTDVEDKIIRRSQEAGLSRADYTKKFEQAFFEDVDSLNIERCEAHPRATDPVVVDKMAEMIIGLLKDGVAYRSNDGSTYYDIKKFADYGRLANICVADLQAGARVSQDEYDKETAADFALWKAWVPEDGDVYWDQYEELGKGRPGWHIECSAMSLLHLGAHFDLHLGGVDLIFPHHQNEIAQSEAYNHEKFVNYWLHCEHLHVEGQKMSKSLGNFYTLRDLLDPAKNASKRAWDPMAIRFTLLKVPYGSRLNFTFSDLAAAETSLDRLKGFLQRCGEQKGQGPVEAEVEAAIERSRQGFVEAMDDNLNIAIGLSHLFEMLTAVNPLLEKGISQAGGEKLAAYLLELDTVLGLRLGSRLAEPGLSPAEQELLDARVAARQAKNWSESDRLRDELAALGIVIEDTPQGVRWKRQ